MSKLTGKNGVSLDADAQTKVVRRLSAADQGHRTYEVYQRERVGESTEKIKPGDLLGQKFQRDPYPTLQILRENYPFYRDWQSNSYWVTRYNDVTSIFTDDANFTNRSKLSAYGLQSYGRDLNREPGVRLRAEQICDALAEPLSRSVITSFSTHSEVNLAIEFAAALAMGLVKSLFAIPSSESEQFTRLYWQMQRGVSWRGDLHHQGRHAIQAMEKLLEPLVAQRRALPEDDYLSALLSVDDRVTTADVVVSLLERDHATLHGGLANLWMLLLTHKEAFSEAVSEPRLMKLAYLEMLRHSTPVVAAERFARHEVERFGKLIPQGARVICSAAAGNRDPRIFSEPDLFVVGRRDLCQREPRGQYRADGLASGIAFGLGKPSKQPAIPADQARSDYAQIRDLAVTASMSLIQHYPQLALSPGSSPYLKSLSVGEMHTCWRLPVVLGPKG